VTDDNYAWRMRFGGFRVSERALFEEHGATLRKERGGRGWTVTFRSPWKSLTFRLRREALALAVATAEESNVLRENGPVDRWTDEHWASYSAAYDSTRLAASTGKPWSMGKL
jgi:hypothetical protein